MQAKKVTKSKACIQKQAVVITPQQWVIFQLAITSKEYAKLPQRSRSAIVNAWWRTFKPAKKKPETFSIFLPPKHPMAKLSNSPLTPAVAKGIADLCGLTEEQRKGLC